MLSTPEKSYFFCCEYNVRERVKINRDMPYFFENFIVINKYIQYSLKAQFKKKKGKVEQVEQGFSFLNLK